MNTPADEIISNALRPLTYLAVPYSYKCPNPDISKTVQRFRFEACTRAAGWLMDQFGWNIFSPITHSHPMHLLCPTMRGDWEFWKKIDLEYISLCRRMVILTLPGWRNSTGVTAELEEGNRLGLELRFVHPTPIGGFFISSTPKEMLYTFSPSLI